MTPARYPQWFADWMDYHLDIYGLSAEVGVSAAFMNWWPAFNAMNVQPYELLSERDENGEPIIGKLGATDIMHRQGNTPLKVSQHFDRLIGIIADERTRKEGLLAIKREMADVDTIGVCDNCGGSGWVNVPHGKSLTHENGVWIWKPHHYSEGMAKIPIHYEMAVTCTCPKEIRIQSWYTDPVSQSQSESGKKKGKSHELPPRPLSLERYEELFTRDWRVLQREVQEARNVIDRTRDTNQNSATDLISSIANKTKLPQKPKPKKELPDGKPSKAGRGKTASHSADERTSRQREVVRPTRNAAAPSGDSEEASCWPDEDPYF